MGSLPICNWNGDLFMAQYVLSLDQGTTSSRAVLFTHDGKVAGIAQHEFAQIYPKTGWVEHDPMDILLSLIHI